MNVRKLLLGLAMITLPTVALLPSTATVANAADAEADEEEGVDEEAAAESDLDELESPESSCADALKECKTKHHVDKALGGSRTACKALRGCKKSCRGDKKADKKEAKKAVRSCKQECTSKKGKERQTCKKECRAAKQDAMKEIRAARKGCVTECRSKNLTPACKASRNDLLKAGADCVKGMATNKDCQEQVKNAFDSLASVFEGN